MVDGGTDGLGEAVVAYVGWDGLLGVDDIIVAEPVQLIGGYPRLHVRSDHVQHFAGKAAGDTHLVLFFGVLMVTGMGIRSR
jgi:hypothetical protein